MAEYDIGDVAHLAVAYTDSEGAPTDPDTVTLTVRDPAGATTTPPTTHDEEGAYSYDLPLDQAGRWVYRWASSDDARATEEGELFVAPSLLTGADPWIPSVTDVADLLHERVQEEGGHRGTTFTDTSNPSARQVRRIIAQQASIALIDFGDLTDTSLICPAPGPDQIRLAVRTLIAQRVAGVIEVSYWPQDAVAGDTAEEFWRRRVEADTARVVQAAKECRLGGVVPGGDDSGGVAMAPVFQFQAGPRVGSRRW